MVANAPMSAAEAVMQRSFVTPRLYSSVAVPATVIMMVREEVPAQVGGCVRKAKGAPFPKRPSYVMAISRILYSEARVRAPAFAPERRSFISAIAARSSCLPALIRRQYSSRNATEPGGNLDRSSWTDRLSSSCLVLHRMGFFLPRESLRAR